MSTEYTATDIAYELRMLQDAGRIAWNESPEHTFTSAGIPDLSVREWGEVPWFGPIDPWLRRTATASDILVDPTGNVVVVDRGMRIIPITNLHPRWVRWLQHAMLTRSEFSIGEDGEDWRNTHGRITHVLEGSIVVSPSRRVRFSLTRPPYTPLGRSLSLRVLHGAAWRLDDLVQQHMLPAECAAMIRTAMEQHVTIVVGGATGSGKTTLVGALLRDIQEREQRRIVIIEDTRELPDPDYGFAVDAQQSGETFAACVRHALRQFPNMIVLGEVRGEEALAMLEAAVTGHPGLATIHATDGRSIFANLERLAARTPDVRPDYVRSIITSGSVSLIGIWLAQRQVREVIEVLPMAAGRGGDLLPLNPLWTWEPNAGCVVPAYPPQGAWYYRK